jgi:hypothetical protein
MISAIGTFALGATVGHIPDLLAGALGMLWFYLVLPVVFGSAGWQVSRHNAGGGWAAAVAGVFIGILTFAVVPALVFVVGLMPTYRPPLWGYGCLIAAATLLSWLGFRLGSRARLRHAT